jgi:hypothetical protein
MLRLIERQGTQLSCFHHALEAREPWSCLLGCDELEARRGKGGGSPNLR